MNIEKLRGHVPDSVMDELPQTIEKFELNTPLRLAHFLGQAAHESGNFKVTTENLNYSADRLLVVFPKYFHSLTEAKQYDHNKEKIANKIYSNRMGNGDEHSGDGFKYKGGGYIQLTGKANYEAFGQAINEDIVSNPEKVSGEYALLSAAWFFHKNKLHIVADGGSGNDVVTKITKVINGGTNGLDERIKNFNTFYALIK